MQVTAGQRYRHFRGGEYIILGVGTHTETLETMVIYTPVEKRFSKIWVRPMGLFSSLAMDQGKVVQRFALLPSLGETKAAV